MSRLFASLAMLTLAATAFASPPSATPAAVQQALLPIAGGDPTLTELASSAWIDSSEDQRNEIHGIMQHHNACMRPLARHLKAWTEQLDAQIHADTAGTGRADSPLRPLIARLQLRMAELNAQTIHRLQSVLLRHPRRSAVAES